MTDYTYRQHSRQTTLTHTHRATYSANDNFYLINFNDDTMKIMTINCRTVPQRQVRSSYYKEICHVPYLNDKDKQTDHDMNMIQITTCDYICCHYVFTVIWTNDQLKCVFDAIMKLLYQYHFIMRSYIECVCVWYVFVLCALGRPKTGHPRKVINALMHIRFGSVHSHENVIALSLSLLYLVFFYYYII